MLWRREGGSVCRGQRLVHCDHSRWYTNVRNWPRKAGKQGRQRGHAHPRVLLRWLFPILLKLGTAKHLNWSFHKIVPWDGAWVQCRIFGKWSQETKVRKWTSETGLGEKVRVIGWGPTETTGVVPHHCAIRGEGRWGIPGSHPLPAEGRPCGTNIFELLGHFPAQGSGNSLIIEERNRPTRWEAVGLLGHAHWLQGNSSDWGKSLLQHIPYFGQWTWAEAIGVTSVWKL